MSDATVFNRSKQIQDMINAWLSDNHMSTVTEIMAKNGGVEEEGVLTTMHQILLQQAIAQEYPDIDSRIQAAGGEKQVLGVLSNVEKELIDDMLENYLAAEAAMKEDFVAVI